MVIRIGLETARAIAYEQMQKAGDASQIECIILDEGTVTLREGWIFFYTSKRYLETGDIESAIGGNCPILVTKAASVILLPTHTHWEDSIKKLQSDPEFRAMGEI